jgi:diphthamide biosynthesis protein 7
MLGCYELDESSGQRRGRLDLYAVPVPDDNGDDESDDLTPITLGKPTNILGEETRESSGILDGKWYQRQQTNESLFYATAHASGEIVVHKVEQASKDGSSNGGPLAASNVGNSESRESALCLALSWDLNPLHDSSSRIISSYSNGQVAIHEVGFQNENKVQLVEQECWDAHKMFQSPAEVWSACFTASNSNVVLTGGDEGYLKIWDLRAGTSRAMHVLKNHFQAGVTVLSPHPRKEHLVACGSYDETVALLDLRKVSECQPKPLCHSEPLGGGMWRIKWHPLDDDRLLLGAMHGGCRVVKLDGLELLGEESHSVELQVQQKFTNHQSMAYGADWLVCQRQGRAGRVQAAISCSFYDRAMYLWQVD